MKNPTSLLIALFTSYLTSVAAASPALPLVTATTAAITRCASGGMRQHDQVVDLAKHEIGEVDFANPKLVLHPRHLDDDELAALVKAWQAIAAEDVKKPSEGPPPGGFFYYTIRDQNGSLRWLSYTNGAPAGQRYVAFSEAQLNTLDVVWPGLTAKKTPAVKPRPAGRQTR